MTDAKREKIAKSLLETFRVVWCDRGTDFPHERDGQWVIVTNGSAISVERIRTYPYDHFVPEGRWFELEDVIAWMPLPKLYGERREP